MAITLSSRLGITRWSASTDAYNRAQRDGDNAKLDNLVALDVQGADFNARPAASIRGRWYTALDTLRTFRDTGTAWVELALKADVDAVREPPGVIKAYAGAAAPTGYLLCNGQVVSRTTYAGLFAVIGTTSGAGDASTTFGVPDLRDRTIVGVSGTKARGTTGGAESVAIGNQHLPSHSHTATAAAGGDHVHTASTGAAGGHNHGGLVDANVAGNQHGHAASITVANSSPAQNTVAGDPTAGNVPHSHGIASDGNHAHTVTVNSGGSHAHTITVAATAAGGTALPTLSPYVAVNYIIKT